MTNKAKMSDRTDPFDWSGGHPALDLVNTLDERPFESPIENLASYADLVRFAELARLIEPAMAVRLKKLGGPACSRVAKQIRTLREHLHDVLAAAHAGRAAPQIALDAITVAIQAAHAARVLIPASSPAHASHRWSAPSAARYSPACLCARDRAPAPRRRPQENPKMRSIRLRCVLPRHKQRSPQTVVQHEKLRQPREAAALALRRQVTADQPGTMNCLACAS